jgi:hypothetical protein
MKAERILETLNSANIGARYYRPEWTNRKLPPPANIIEVSATDYARAVKAIKPRPAW